MDHFNYRDGELFAEEVPVAKIAEQFGSPCYVYSRATLERHWHAFNDALGAHPHKICYAVKANSNLAVLNLFARLGSGFDIVSQGELERVVAAGGDPSQVIFSGVGKQEAEMARALELGIYCFNIESGPGLEALNQVATRLGKHAPIAIRLNPDVDPKTHPYISTGLKENKFGVTTEEAIELYRKAAKMPNIVIKGLDCHIGSQLTELQPFLGKWLQVNVDAIFGSRGRLVIKIMSINDNHPLMHYENSSLNMWKEDADFIRPKWGIYRSLNDKQSLRDEVIDFADIQIRAKSTTRD